MNSDRLGMGLGGKAYEKAFDESAYVLIGPLQKGVYEMKCTAAFYWRQGPSDIHTTATSNGDDNSWDVPAGDVERFSVNGTSEAYIAVKRASGTGSVNLRIRSRDKLDSQVP